MSGAPPPLKVRAKAAAPAPPFSSAPPPPAPQVAAAAKALAAGRPDVAEDHLRSRLEAEPNDADALRLLGELATMAGRFGDAEALFDHALTLRPDDEAARYALAGMLHKAARSPEALTEALKLRAARPADPLHRALEAAIRGGVGDHALSLQLYEGLFAQGMDGPRLRLSHGHTLKTLGRAEEAAVAYRRLAASAHPEDRPLRGEAWWSLANLKSRQLGADDVSTLRRLLADPSTPEDSRAHAHYALGAALEDAGEAGAAFDAYAAGAVLRRRRTPYDPAATAEAVRRAMQVFTPALMAARAGQGCAAPDPIFVVGLPRSGSTLVEQILASHSQVEGTMELAEIQALAGELGRRPEGYPETLPGLTPGDLRELGEFHLRRTRPYRKTDRPFFVDKMPDNWLHVGLIRLILPRARIIDVRRHPMATGWSVFKQLFARAQAFSYDLSDIGAYYRDYVALMAHFEAATPGAVHRLIYEDLVADPEREVRRLLAYCGLEFEAACLRFHETRRAIRTPSSEQVRRPLNADSLDRWRRVEDRLEPLKAALGPVLETWRS